MLAFACAIAAPLSGQPSANVIVIIETAKGNIEIEVDAARAPLSAANFLKYVEGGFYDGGTVNRAVRPDNTVAVSAIPPATTSTAIALGDLDLPMYHADGILRRATALQQTREACG